MNSCPTPLAFGSGNGCSSACNTDPLAPRCLLTIEHFPNTPLSLALLLTSRYTSGSWQEQTRNFKELLGTKQPPPQTSMASPSASRAAASAPPSFTLARC